ncbi:hypothetical protein [uncultured Aquabacterium sp.]|nr:hypothetical protein [uncultured Aquabacterium sp.]
MPFMFRLPVPVPALGPASSTTRMRCGLLLVAMAMGQGAWAQEKPVYRCPGNLYTDALSPKEAQQRGCRTLDGAPITVIQSSQPVQRPAATGAQGSQGGSGSAPKVSSDEQRARDADRRRILEAELRKEEEALAALQKEFNNGEPERRGDERNYAKYQERVAAMRDALTRKEADVAALRRELGALGAAR